MNDFVAELATAKRALDIRWAETCELWRDSVQMRFEKEYWLPIDSETRRTLDALDEMAKTLDRMQREVP